MEPEPFVIGRTYNASIEQVWQALTDPQLMKQWYFDTQGFKPEVGTAFTFNGGNEGRVYVHRCQITEAVPNQKLGYTWRYEGYEGASLLTFELFGNGDKTTRLKLTHEGLETFAGNGKDFQRESFEQGWDYITGTALKKFLEKQTA